MIDILKQNTGLAIMAGLWVAVLLVCGLFVLIMSRSGISLRPLVFFLGLFSIVVMPQLIGHLVNAVEPGSMPVTTAQGTPMVISGMAIWSLEARDGALVDPVAAFGPMAGSVRQDMRGIYQRRMPGLQAADVVQWPTGESSMALVFDSEGDATNGLLAYLGMYQVAVELDRGGAEVKGSRGLGGDRMHLQRSGGAMLVFTALNDEMLNARMAACPVLAAPVEPNEVMQAEASVGNALFPTLQPLKRMFQPVWMQLIGVLLMVLVASIWFFKGVVWASSVPAGAVAVPLHADVLRERLLAVNKADVPMEVTSLDDGRSEITWRYADAKWMGLMKAHGMKRTHRMLLGLDAASKVVRVTEQWSTLDWSAGAGGGRKAWTNSVGINFFQVDHKRAYGLQFGPDGHAKSDLSYIYTFNLQELKAPFIAAVTQAGWTWKPVLIEAPTALRWATE